MTIEKLVIQLRDAGTVIKVLSDRDSRELYHGPAKGAVELGYGNYRIVRVGPNGLIWYWG